VHCAFPIRNFPGHLGSYLRSRPLLLRLVSRSQRQTQTAWAEPGSRRRPRMAVTSASSKIIECLTLAEPRLWLEPLVQPSSLRETLGPWLSWGTCWLCSGAPWLGQNRIAGNSLPVVERLMLGCSRLKPNSKHPCLIILLFVATAPARADR
jgi:hypothetical protein